jgi:hypothetical protein
MTDEKRPVVGTAKLTINDTEHEMEIISTEGMTPDDGCWTFCNANTGSEFKLDTENWILWHNDNPYCFQFVIEDWINRMSDSKQ